MERERDLELIRQRVYNSECPFCGDPDLSYSNIEIDGNEARQEAYCDICGKAWIEVYEIKGIQLDDDFILIETKKNT